MSLGIFGDLFDFDGDGKLDWLEQAMEIDAFCRMTEEQEEEEEEDMDELDMYGIDRDELEFMDEDERREVLEEAGLDPDDYDFL